VTPRRPRSTSGVYSHVIAGLDKEAADKVASLILPVSSPLAQEAGGSHTYVSFD
jgi:hypothetical protein